MLDPYTCIHVYYNILASRRAMDNRALVCVDPDYVWDACHHSSFMSRQLVGPI